MFRKVLIANRGEIAVRIIRACRELSIRSVAVYSTADRTSLHAQIADEAVCIGPAATKDSYLNMNAIIQAALNTGADAIHPGFGFLSENAEFAKLCEANGIVFIGPSYKSIEMLGDKAAAKETMAAAGVPVIPGSKGAVKSLEEARSIADKAGYPVLVKASAGGGGRGIRRVDSPEELEAQMTAAQQEAKNFFGDDAVYIEKFLINPHHVEIQIIADKHGNYIHLCERDCSMQRRNQKMLEECPSPIVDEKLRAKMGAAAVTAAKECGYYNAGTIEFLVDENRDFYFMEMNTRIQVEHPITEEVTGFDLVKAQIEIADGKPLEIKQEDVTMRGHAIECRINAENPDKGFRPSPGTITALYMPGGPGIRIDGAVYQGYTITPYYDSMISKLIAHGSDREDAINKMRWALSEFIVEGVDTNIDFQLEIIRNADFKAGKYDIGFLGRFMEEKKK
ncbi:MULTISPECIES: acetyl-CoA carboxylase biotin carboxylase subunit [Ruminococcus]|uniref:Biotin carboxylase n=1 Tax=Ruminococcus flavefaciens TaxID=1265 RepID=A0A315XUY7_RUMFL|nr:MULTISPECIES: acetyl-CoA carboxylase biotin carboxylase subunit [Ruminococcus]MBQ6170262.1 acetyl-CoA carboxylase biotin carboxylase subunit [Ruminococcus sp.]MBR1430546.1 acetyl-CoA carboxylase biotin carboxylase subunit [Ruminococcus sp.]PWJ10590.1 acetyl-CoA carboxylase biotin carboxylase subunit [Ruminococcus flavefaciens]SSA51660.1 acetyl-CoA carboxylase, biotin carboxylase subunit [Ruminococcus flavefaciens]